jgi:tetratricopeptide (TPR) repeat protein
MGKAEQATARAADRTHHEADGPALAWAHGAFSFNTAEPVTDEPWARTYRLNGHAATAYLKILPPVQAHVLKPIAALTHHFEGQLPRLIAVDAARGWALSAEHGARGLTYDSDEADLLNLARSYGRLQAQIARTPALFDGLPHADIGSLLAQLWAFLASPAGANEGSGGPVGAAYFLGDEAAARYHRLLLRRSALLERHLAAAAGLPPTINHGDLRPPNAAVAQDGHCTILDWDDAIVGPAGMSLHGLFSGCSLLAILLSGSAAAQAAAATPNGVRIAAYIDALVEGGYADAAALRRCLPATACAGEIQFLLNFAKFPGENGRGGVRGTMKSRFSDLLNLCDLLAARDEHTNLEYAQDYADRGEYQRAQQLLQNHLARHPDDADAWARLGIMMRRLGKLQDAEEALRDAIERSPHTAAWQAELGGVLMERLDIDESKRRLQLAIEQEPGLSTAAQDLQRVIALEQTLQQAALPQQMPILRCDDSEAAGGALRPEKLALGVKLFETYGAMQIDNALPVAMIERLQEAFMQRYSPYFRADDHHPDALRLGDKRYMLTVDIDALFGDPGLIGSPMVLPIVRRVLGDDCVLGAFTAVISLPGSRDQRLHKDHPALFPDTPWHFTLPAFAAQLIVPLVPLNEFSGSTRFYKGTHRVPTEKAEEMGAQDPVVPLGSCLLNDFRCAHRGLGNRSQAVRPILTLIFNRPWFRDSANYGKQPPLRLSEAAYEQMPARLQPLVSWWREERRLDQLDHSQLIQPREVPAAESEVG